MPGEIGEIWTAVPPLQPNHPESDRLLGTLPARAQLRLPEPELQAPDRAAASAAAVRSWQGHRVGQGTRADLVCVLWRGDDDRANADSIRGLAAGHHAHPPENLMIV